jgi:glycine/D-amino acid oxidase-like deaminating enzyme
VTRILVIGGGVAGTTTALALHKAGVDVSGYEAQHNITVSGNVSRGVHAPSRTGREPAARSGDDELASLLEWDSPIAMSRPGAAVPGEGA